MKLIFFDIDGTLAVPGNPPGALTVEAIRACRAKGNKVFLSTGRTEAMVAEDIREIGFDGGIYSAGGRILVGDKELLKRTMSPELVEHIRAAMDEAGVNYTMECAVGTYEGNMEIMEEAVLAENGSSELQRILEVRKTLGSRHPVEEYAGEPVYKISYLATSQEQIDYLVQTLEQEAKVVCFDNLLPGLSVMAGEVSDTEINKGAALRFLCDHYHVGTDQSIAFGDSMNDSEILEAAGTGIAMGNSTEKVKKLADRICGNCEDDGVGRALQEMGLC